MSRLVQELPQIISLIWTLNTVDCLGGKSSAKVMRCVFSPVLFSSTCSGAFSCQKVEKKVAFATWASISCEDVSRSKICHKGGFTENVFSNEFQDSLLTSLMLSPLAVCDNLYFYGGTATWKSTKLEKSRRNKHIRTGCFWDFSKFAISELFIAPWKTVCLTGELLPHAAHFCAILTPLCKLKCGLSVSHQLKSWTQPIPVQEAEEETEEPLLQLSCHPVAGCLVLP